MRRAFRIAQIVREATSAPGFDASRRSFLIKAAAAAAVLPLMPEIRDLLRFVLLFVVAAGGFFLIDRAPAPEYITLPASFVYVVSLGWGYHRRWGHRWPFHGMDYWSMPGVRTIAILVAIGIVLGIAIAFLVPFEGADR